MEQSIELRIRRVTRNKYDIVLLREDSVIMERDVSLEYALDWLRAHLGSQLFNLGVGASINFESKVKIR